MLRTSNRVKVAADKMNGGRIGFALAAVSMLLFASSASYAEIILLSDNFNTNTTTRLFGEDLRFNDVQDGTLASNKTYAGQNDIAFGTNYLTQGTSGKRVYVALSSNDMPTGYTTLSSSLDMAPQFSSTLAFGFTTNAAGVGDNINTDGQLWIRAFYDTNASHTVNTLFYDGTTEIAAITNAGGGMGEYNITYDFADNTVSATAGGTAMVSGYDLDNLSYTPDLQALQFQVGGGDGNRDAIADDLLVVAIPEPSSTALIILASALFLRRVGMRKRSL